MKSTERFGSRAQDYAAGRPSYPDRALDVLLAGLGEPTNVVAVDLGAGTGISSRLLAARGAQVTAVEPNGPMRAAAVPCSGVEWVDATAEFTGRANASADLVTAFQAFHWFASDITLREMLRILRPGGRAAIVYNERDERDPFTQAYGQIVRRFHTDDTELRRDSGRKTFAAFAAWQAVCTSEVPNEQRLNRRELRARVGSTSYLPHEGAAFEELIAAIDELFEESAVENEVTMHMKTIVTVADSGDRPRADG